MSSTMQCTRAWERSRAGIEEGGLPYNAAVAMLLAAAVYAHCIDERNRVAAHDQEGVPNLKMHLLTHMLACAGKAVGLSFVVLIMGALLGTLVHNWVRVDIVPIGSFGSPGVFCTEFVLVGMLLGALFLA